MSRCMAVLCLGVLTAITSTAVAQSPTAPPLTNSSTFKLYKASGPNATQGDIEAAVDGIFSLSGASPLLAQTLQVRSKIVSAEMAYPTGNNMAPPARVDRRALHQQHLTHLETASKHPDQPG